MKQKICLPLENFLWLKRALKIGQTKNTFQNVVSEVLLVPKQFVKIYFFQFNNSIINLKYTK